MLSASIVNSIVKRVLQRPRHHQHLVSPLSTLTSTVRHRLSKSSPSCLASPSLPSPVVNNQHRHSVQLNHHHQSGLVCNSGNIVQQYQTKSTILISSSSRLARHLFLLPARSYSTLTTAKHLFVPCVSTNFFINSNRCFHLSSAVQSNDMPPVSPETTEFDYDLIVIGGGSGGLAASKEAAALGKKVALLDFVTPTPQGTKWGIGGTCVNVGCIPKKLMHHASLIGQEIEDAQFFGWKTKEGNPLKDNLQHDWGTLVTHVQNNIKGSNFSYRGLLNSANVKYINAYGSFVSPHKLKIVHKNSKEEFITAKDFIVSTGERPRYPTEVEGVVKYSITSDDLFSLPYNPGKTLVIGASYVALECAGFLRGFGNDVTVMVRSIVLRGFDRQCSELVRNYMEEMEKVRFIDTCVPKKIEQIKEPKDGELQVLRVTYSNLKTNEVHTEEFNTVLFAVGRTPCTENIGLEVVGVDKDQSGYIPTVNEQTNVKNIYAVGDIVKDKPQLTPVAIEAGILLVRRLYANSTVQCDYVNVPTTVFTPLEYGCCGLSEEDAIAKYGEDNIEVYHQYFSPTEWRLNYYDRPRKPMNKCYAKLITTRSLNNNPNEEQILGFHYLGPNAGEVTQFIGLPMKMKATKADLDALIGIHPTNAEIFTTLTITKRSGKDATQQGCCG